MISFGEFWGAAILISLFFWWPGYVGVRLLECKALFLACATFVSLGAYGIPKLRIGLKWPVAVILGIAFWKIYNITSHNSIHQWLMISCGGLFFLQVAAHEKAGPGILKTYLGIACMALSASVLLSALPYDLAAPYSVRFYQSDRGERLAHEALGFIMPGALGNQGFSSMFIALTFPFLSSWSGIVLALSALSAVAWIGTATPLLVVLGSLALWGIMMHGQRFRPTKLAIVVGLVALIPLGGSLSKGSFAEDGGRFKMWGLVVENITRAPLLGYGPGVFRDAMGADDVPKDLRAPSGRAWDFICNDYLAAVHTFGLVGALAILALLVQAWRGRKRDYPCAMAALIAAGMALTWPVFSIASVSFVAIIVLAILANNGGPKCSSTWP